jgi:hypothetical protein
MLLPGVVVTDSHYETHRLCRIMIRRSFADIGDDFGTNWGM